MLVKHITYKNMDGHEITEPFYFNMTKAELIKLNMKEGEGFQDYLQKIIASADGNAIIQEFDKLIGLAYGERTQDGKFVKTPQAYEAFKASEAYSEFFMELATSAEKSAEFIRGIMPTDLAESVAKAEKEIGISQNLQDHVDLPEPVKLPTAPEPEYMTDEELLNSLGVSNQDRVEKVITAGYTDEEILKMSGRDLAGQDREVLLRAYWLKQNQ